MPVTYSNSGKIFRLDCVGESTSLEVMNALEGGLWDSALSPEGGLLVDVRYSTSVSQQSDVDLLWIAGVIGARSKRFGRRCAVLAPPSMLETLAHIGEAFAPEFGTEAQFFLDEAAALVWLGADIGEAQTISVNV